MRRHSFTPKIDIWLERKGWDKTAEHQGPTCSRCDSTDVEDIDFDPETKETIYRCGSCGNEWSEVHGDPTHTGSVADRYYKEAIWDTDNSDVHLLDMACPKCNGAKDPLCSMCRGDGSVSYDDYLAYDPNKVLKAASKTCYNCKGKGTLRDLDEPNAVCEICNGSGRTGKIAATVITITDDENGSTFLTDQGDFRLEYDDEARKRWKEIEEEEGEGWYADFPGQRPPQPYKLTGPNGYEQTFSASGDDAVSPYDDAVERAIGFIEGVPKTAANPDDAADLWARCSLCDNSGNCPGCNGDGCEQCGGWGLCPGCDGESAKARGSSKTAVIDRTAACPNCGDDIHPDEDWHVKCATCGYEATMYDEGPKVKNPGKKQAAGVPKCPHCGSDQVTLPEDWTGNESDRATCRACGKTFTGKQAKTAGLITCPKCGKDTVEVEEGGDFACTNCDYRVTGPQGHPKKAYYASVPMKWPGTEEEKKANYLTHVFIYDQEGDGRCGNCDCRPWGTVAEWPCGADVPRVDVNRTAAADYDDITDDMGLYRYKGYEVIVGKDGFWQVWDAQRNRELEQGNASSIEEGRNNAEGAIDAIAKTSAGEWVVYSNDSEPMPCNTEAQAMREARAAQAAGEGNVRIKFPDGSTRSFGELNKDRAIAAGKEAALVRTEQLLACPNCTSTDLSWVHVGGVEGDAYQCNKCSQVWPKQSCVWDGEKFATKGTETDD